MPRQSDGRETWNRLLNWDKGQASSERLSAQILVSNRFESIDPSHPLGGRDGLKDIICKKEEKKFIAACYFPRGQQTFKNIKTKFLNDSKGFDKNSVDGLIFVTNQELRLGERDELVSLLDVKYEVVIFHLERIAALLNAPENYGIRLEYLDIEMTKEEQLSFMASKDIIIQDLVGFLKQRTNSTEFVKKELSYPEEVIPEYIPPRSGAGYLRLGEPFHKCTYCGYGYKIAGGSLDHYSLSIDPVSMAVKSNAFSMSSFGSKQIITCPKCGNTEEYINL